MANRFCRPIIVIVTLLLFGFVLSGACAPAPTVNRKAATSIDPGTAFSPLVFDLSYYKLVNPDLSGLSDADLQAHWLNHGIAEGRRAHPLFWTQQYLALYPDLQAKYGAQNYPAALVDYVTSGHDAGLAGVLALAPTVFNVAYYKQVNPDLAILSDTDAETHWIENGISETRHGHPRFFAPDYLFLNYDKAIQLGADNNAAAVDDYALNGANQGRIGLDALMPLVFDPAYYMNRHPELNFQSTDDAITYWLQTGLAKGDKGSNVFSASEYLGLYPDLLQAFGATGYADALEHYVRHGRHEGRSGLFAIDQSYLSFIPTSDGGPTTPADRVETFTSVTGQTITVTVRAPVPNDTTFTMRPINPGELPDDYFPEAVVEAQAAGAGTLMIPMGVYNFQGTHPDLQWAIQNVTDMTIDGQGSTLNFSKPEAAIGMNSMTRVVFKNFVIDWPNLQIAALGKIVTDPNNPAQNLLQIDPAYAFDVSKTIETLSTWDVANNTWGRQAQIEDAFAPALGTNNPPPTYLGNRLYSSPDFNLMPVGTIFIVRYYLGEGPGILVGGAEDFALENVVFHSVPGMAIFLDLSRGVRVSNCVVDRSPGKLISATSGALQLNNSEGDVLVEGNKFAYHGDDGINIGAAGFFPITAVNGTQLTLSVADSTPVVGEPVIIFNSAYGVLGYSTIQTVSQNSDGGFDVQLNDAIPHIASDGWLGRLNVMGARWIVRNNQFLNNHARAILPQGPYGLLEDNVMQGQTSAAILAGILNDVPPAAVGPGVQDMQVLNNLISDVGFFSAPPGIPIGGTSPGAVMIVSWLMNGFNLNDESGSTDVPVNQNIVLSGNTVRNLPGPAFFIGSAANITLDQNEIINSNNGPFYYLGTANTLGSIVVSQAQNVSITNTVVSGPNTGPASIDLHSTGGIQDDRSTTLSLSLAAGSDPSAFAQPVSFTAVVTPQAGGIPTGTVQFMDGTTNIGSPVALDSTGTASLATSSLSLGEHAINAVYSGDANFDGSTAQIDQTVGSEASMISVTSSSDPAAASSSLTLIATVTAGFGSLVGSVQFQDNGADLGSLVPLSAGTALLPTSSLSPGVHSITAVYCCDPNFFSSISTPFTQIITATGGTNSTSTAFKATAQTFFRQSATFAVTVSSSGGTPAGNVLLMDGDSQLGPMLTLDGNGAANYSTPLRPGVHQIQAIYIGDGVNFNGSFAGQMVNASPRPKPR